MHAVMRPLSAVTVSPGATTLMPPLEERHDYLICLRDGDLRSIGFRRARCVAIHEWTPMTTLQADKPLAPPAPGYVGVRLEAWRRKTDGALFLFAAASIPLLLLELQRGRLSPGDQMFVDIANVVIFAVFAADYVVELVKTEDRRAYVRGEWLMALVVVTSGVALIPAAGAIGALRLMRLLRPVSGLIRVVSVGGLAVRDARRFLRRKMVRSAFMAGAVVWLTSAAAFMLAEGGGAEGTAVAYADALWWSFTTMVSGETYIDEPVTLAGKLISAFTMVVGLSIFAAVIARVAAFLVIDDDLDGIGVEVQPGIPSTQGRGR